MLSDRLLVASSAALVDSLYFSSIPIRLTPCPMPMAFSLLPAAEPALWNVSPMAWAAIFFSCCTPLTTLSRISLAARFESSSFEYIA